MCVLQFSCELCEHLLSYLVECFNTEETAVAQLWCQSLWHRISEMRCFSNLLLVSLLPLLSRGWRFRHIMLGGGFPTLLMVISGEVSVLRGHCNLKGHLDQQLRRGLGSDVGVTIEGGIHLYQCTSCVISLHSTDV